MVRPLWGAVATHVDGRGGSRRLLLLLVAALVVVYVAHDRLVLLPWTGGLSIALDPIAPAAYVLPLVALVDPRRFTLEPAGGREVLVRASVLAALGVGVGACTAAICVVQGTAAGVLALRGALFFVGATLLLSRLGDVRFAALLVSVLAWVVGWLGSPDGPLEAYSWLAYPVSHPGAWLVCGSALVAGVLADLLDGRTWGSGVLPSGRA